MKDQEMNIAFVGLSSVECCKLGVCLIQLFCCYKQARLHISLYMGGTIYSDFCILLFCSIKICDYKLREQRTPSDPESVTLVCIPF